MNNELAHHGVKGQKWGVRRSPAQLGRRRTKAKAPEETPEQIKARVIKSKSAKELYKHADLFSDKELRDVYNRIQLERDIQRAAGSELSRGERFVNKSITLTKKATEVLNAGSSAYNAIDKVRKIFEGDGSPKKTSWMNKKASDLSDDALKKAVNRMNTEKRFNDLYGELNK